MNLYFKLHNVMAGLILKSHPCVKKNKKCLFFEYLQMILVPFFALSTSFGFTKNLMSFPFQAPVFFALFYQKGGDTLIFSLLIVLRITSIFTNFKKEFMLKILVREEIKHFIPFY